MEEQAGERAGRDGPRTAAGVRGLVPGARPAVVRGVRGRARRPGPRPAPGLAPCARRRRRCRSRRGWPPGSRRRRSPPASSRPPRPPSSWSPGTRRSCCAARSSPAGRRAGCWPRSGVMFPLVTRALPLLLLFTTFLFINTEVWQVASSLPRSILWTAVLLFAAVAVAFLLVRLPEELDGVTERIGDGGARAQRAPAGEPAARAAGRPRRSRCWRSRSRSSGSSWSSGWSRSSRTSSRPGSGTAPTARYWGVGGLDVRLPVSNELFQVSIFLAAFSGPLLHRLRGVRLQLPRAVLHPRQPAARAGGRGARPVRRGAARLSLTGQSSPVG